MQKMQKQMMGHALLVIIMALFRALCWQMGCSAVRRFIITARRKVGRAPIRAALPMAF